MKDFFRKAAYVLSFIFGMILFIPIILILLVLLVIIFLVLLVTYPFFFLFKVIRDKKIFSKKMKRLEEHVDTEIYKKED